MIQQLNCGNNLNKIHADTGEFGEGSARVANPGWKNLGEHWTSE